MAYEGEKEKEYQKNIPAVLKRLYQQRHQAKNPDYVRLKNLKYRLKHGQKKQICSDLDRFVKKLK